MEVTARAFSPCRLQISFQRVVITGHAKRQAFLTVWLTLITLEGAFTIQLVLISIYHARLRHFTM